MGAAYPLCGVFRFARPALGALFALARTAGWVAHVQEQRQTGMLLRPRAKFVGAVLDAT
ncbi:citrate/2-methylcitrate synthase [Variovorax sp. J31P179]|uniref:citrate/2-methylcitrate synthase n=1 Tax=Variovorax sp. J31P179 TaxID=3053508 RepID=UPI002578D5AA|nr:citrate/2-methylcitrate synthase [Variovorax sp. J31P179]MDM0084662.1 citrate/2-methylcitrate synthase [Variovorax sp. J31P179]